jgi:tetratricopeptide (TPR) repeat protein
MRVFLSHSKYDKATVEEVWRRLGPRVAWLDRVEIDVGDIILEKVEEGIKQATDFVLFWSKNASESQWVRIEVHMGFIRVLEQSGCKLRVVTLDNTPLRLYLKPFLYLDVSSSPDSAAEVIAEKLLAEAEQPRGSVRRLFVDRHDELQRLEAAVDSPEIYAILIHGIYGIGKRSLLTRAVENFFTPPEVAGLTVKPGTGWIELALEVCALSGIMPPQEGASREDVEVAVRTAIEQIHAKGAILAFYEVQHWIDEDGHTLPVLAKLLQWFASIPAMASRPIFLTSTRAPALSAEQRKSCQILRIEGLKAEDLSAILRRWLEVEKGDLPIDKPKLDRVSSELWGYPLAARLAASLVAQYGPDYLIQHPREIIELRVDLAKDLLAHTRVSEEGNLILQTLSAIDVPVPAGCVANALGLEPEKFTEGINSALYSGVLSMEGLALTIHPLVRDFYWRRLSLRNDYADVLRQLSHKVREYLPTLVIGSVEYATLLPAVFRLVALTGDIKGARRLRSDLTETLVATAIQLYNRPKIKPTLELALRYVDLVLEGESDHWQARLYRARCLYQLGRTEEASEILMKMKAERPQSWTVLHALGRVQMKEQHWQPALAWFQQALQLRSDYVPSLRDSAECYLRLGDKPNAEGFAKQAKSVNPSDPYVLHVESLILEENGALTEAYEIMKRAREQEPENASFAHRMGRIAELMAEETGEKEYRDIALGHYDEAVKLDGDLLEARLSKASMLIDLNKLRDAETEINALKPKVPPPRIHILRGIEAKLLLAKDELDEALKVLRRNSDAASFGLRAKIEIRRAAKQRDQSYTALAEQSIAAAKKYVAQGLKRHPGNNLLVEIQRQLENLR